MMGKRFAKIVEECLHRLDRGENLPEVLADFPLEAAQLKPLLLVAMASRSMDIQRPNPTSQRLGKNHMFSEMDRVGAGPAAGRVPLRKRIFDWTGKTINSFRARNLIRPTPSYRMAMTSLLILFGLGWFVISASASPGDLINAITTDFQQVLAFLYRDPSDAPQNSFKLISISGGSGSSSSANRAAKVVFLRDFLGGDEPRGYNPGGTPPPDSTQDSGRDLAGEPADPPVFAELPDDIAAHSADPVDVPAPCPHPADIVNEVVSDTAKEKNPVWDQLPFNQCDQIEGDVLNDQDQSADCDEGDIQIGPPTWVLDKKKDKDNKNKDD